MKSEYISSKNWKIIFQHLDYVDAVALRLALFTGLRINDVLTLKPANLSDDGVLTCVQSKTKKPFKKRLPKEILRSVRMISSNRWLFPSWRDDWAHINRSTVYRHLQDARSELGILTRVTPHSTRKTFGAETYHKLGLDATIKALDHDRESTTLLYALSDIIAEGSKREELVSSDEYVERIAESVMRKMRLFFTSPEFLAENPNECSDLGTKNA